MKPNPVIAAVRKLTLMGYRFKLDGATIKARYIKARDLRTQLRCDHYWPW